jgi:hypothetical protein
MLAGANPINFVETDGHGVINDWWTAAKCVFGGKAPPSVLQNSVIDKVLLCIGTGGEDSRSVRVHGSRWLPHP